MQSNKTFSVSQLSKIADISVRTLHYYDQTGLLTPNRRLDNGYRQYSTTHLHLLQQILIYRELDFTIEDIKQLLNANDIELRKNLQSQHSLLNKKKAQIHNMIKTIEKTMRNLSSNNYDHLFAGLPKEKAQQWAQMTREQVGDEQYELRMQKVAASLTPAQAKEMNLTSDAISKDMANLLEQPIYSREVQSVVKAHYDMLVDLYGSVMDGFSGLSREAYSKMALKFITIPQMKAARDYYAEGTAEHLSEAMIYFAEKNLQ